MTFLSAFFLVALPLALAPVALHLFDRRRNVVLDWGAMQFLVEATTQRTSARRLKQWLLLVLRMLVVAALVMALARPMLPGHWLGGAEQAEIIVVIDNSMSTQRAGDAASLFAQIQQQALTRLGELPSGSVVRVLQAAPYPIWSTSHELKITDGPSDELNRHLAGIQPTSGGSDLLAALFTAVQADLTDSSRSRRILLITDGQAADWKTADSSGWERLQGALRTAPIPTELEIVEMHPAQSSMRNLAVNSLRSSRVLVGVGQSFSLTAEIVNYSPTESKKCHLKWRVAGRDENITEVPALLSNNSHEAAWRYSFSRPGVYAVSCELVAENGQAPDELEPDNRATVVVEVRDEVPVLVVESAGGQSELQQDAYFLQAAMGWTNGQPLEEHTVFRPVVVSPNDLLSIGLSDFRAVVIPNYTHLDAEVIDRLKLFVMNGGGLWIAMGPRGDVEMFNQHLFAAGDGLSALGLEGIVSEPDANKSPTISATTRNHPATAELADGNRVDTSDIRVRRRFRFAQPSRGNDVSVLLSLSHGEPLAVEKYLGQGRAIVLGIPLTMRDWSDLARSQAFVVMVQDWLNYLTQPQATRHNLLPGDPIVLHLPEGSHRDAFLKTPAGDSVELAAEPLLDGVLFRSTRTTLPGDYTLQLGLSGESIPFHVQRPAIESNLAELSDAERQLLKETIKSTESQAAGDMLAVSHRDPVWPILLMLLIGFMVVELILSGMISRERFGLEAIPETVEQINPLSLEPVTLAKVPSWAKTAAPAPAPVKVEQ